MAEREGFEPSESRKEFTRFPGEPVRPLWHLSEDQINRNRFGEPNIEFLLVRYKQNFRGKLFEQNQVPDFESIALIIIVGTAETAP